MKEREQSYYEESSLKHPCQFTKDSCRLGLSKLRGDLFTFNLIDNPVCPLCIDAFESAHHFCFVCPSLHVQRNEWMVKLRSLVSDIDSYKQIDLLRVCIHGSVNSSFKFNSSIL